MGKQDAGYSSGPMIALGLMHSLAKGANRCVRLFVKPLDKAIGSRVLFSYSHGSLLFSFTLLFVSSPAIARFDTCPQNCSSIFTDLPMLRASRDEEVMGRDKGA